MITANQMLNEAVAREKERTKHRWDENIDDLVSESLEQVKDEKDLYMLIRYLPNAVNRKIEKWKREVA